MKKAILQLLIFLLLFFAIWGLLNLIDWRGVSNLEIRGDQLEEKLGTTLREILERQETFVEDEEIVAPVDSILTRITESNEINRDQIKLHIIEKDQVNAFALPDGHLGIFTGLIGEAENEQELAGVLAHEVAHIDQEHVMEKLMRELGLSILVSVATGNTGSGTVGEAIRLLTSSAYSRSLEEEADEYAVTYLHQADIDPEPFGEFMYRIAREQPDLPDQLKWFQTHPDPEDRAYRIIELLSDKEDIDYHKVLNQSTWEQLKSRVSDN